MNLLVFLSSLSESEREELKELLNTSQADEFFDSLAGDQQLTKTERMGRRTLGKIPIIRAVRERTSLGLKEAKHLVERECPDEIYGLPACPRCGQWERNIKRQSFDDTYGVVNYYLCICCNKSFESKERI